MSKQLQAFKNGSTWLRADFHLHTRADKEFNYSGDPNYFVTNYINQLKKQNIRIGTITNHNKLALDEFKELRKNALREEIYLLPGVEFSATDGGKGIHVLIVFSDEWIFNKENTNYIKQFLNSAFMGIPGYDKAPYPNSRYSLQQTYEALNTFNKDYFFVMAHVDDNNGLFKELEGRNFETLIKSEAFSRKVLGLQKIRSNDNKERLKATLKNENALPAFVEGTDNAHEGIEGIGNGNKVKGITQQTYLKLGAYNFEAIKYALMDKEHRLSKNPVSPSNGYIKKISFKGQKLEETIYLNHSMNNLIGIRGSGKSSILEAIRYALDMELSEKEHEDHKYKNNIVNALLGSGGKIECTLIDDQGKEYKTEKTLGDPQSAIFDANGTLQIALKPRAIVKKPIYYGQKDLSKTGHSLSTENLIRNLAGERLTEKKRETDEQKLQVIRLLDEIKTIDSKIARKPEYEARLAELELKIKQFKDHKIDEKLEKQINFNKDINFIERVRDFEVKILDALYEFIQEYDDFGSYKSYKSKENDSDLKKAIQSLFAFEDIFSNLGNTLRKLIDKTNELENIRKGFTDKYNLLKEEFSQLKRAINLPDIQADDYIKFTKDLDITKAQLSELEKLSGKKRGLQTQLEEALLSLQNCWHREYEIIQQEISQVNKEQAAVNTNGKETKTIEITAEHKADKKLFKSYLEELFKGSNIRKDKFQAIVNNYPDLISIYKDFDQPESFIVKTLPENQLSTFKKYFESNIGACLTYRTPDKFDIIYRGRPLHEHSLGQRASALIIFLLTLKDSDLIIIDQPEDDLDNQTIYNDVIKVLKELKNNSQFLFVTHNPNIPVLGDGEQIITCEYQHNKIATKSGSIDSEHIREDIVNIMEGGKEAFNNRRRIYELWTH